ncbi:MAG: hypothetical protein K0Q54_3542, partial [Methylobacterium brachiatum]|nr:hypothetical protein [Methylobacterium brachiatum]
QNTAAAFMPALLNPEAGFPSPDPC